MESIVISNRYTVLKVLGKGGMGEIFLCEDRLNSNAKTAVKQISTSFITDNNIKSIKNEFDIMSRLTHPNIVQVFDFFFDNKLKQYLITMEYLTGDTLRSHIGQFSLKNQSQVFVEICRALMFIHSRNILHRDISPDNIWIENGHVKLLDFGLSDLKENIHDYVQGTLPFMAPEVLHREYSSSSDFFATALTLFELTTGKNFYDGISYDAIPPLLKNKTSFENHHKEIFSQSYDSPLIPLIEQMTLFTPSERLSSGEEIIESINTICKVNHSIETPESKRAYVLGVGFIGRQKEYSLLKEHINNNEESVICIKGEPGIGKSRLFFEFRKHCRLNNIHFFEGSCFENVSRQFGPFIPILSELLFMVSEKTIKQYGPTLKKILPEHPILVNTDMVKAEDPRTEFRILLKNISSFLFIVAKEIEESYVIYINDIHWIDFGSASLIDRIITVRQNIDSSSANPIICLSTRPESSHLIEGMKSYTSLRSYTLTPFTREDVNEFILSTFGKDSVQTNLLKQAVVFQSRSEGNPLFLQEIIKTLVEDNTINRYTRGWDSPSGDYTISIPTSLHELIKSRLNKQHLSHDEMTTLHCIALINRYISYEELSQIHKTTPEFLRRMKRREILKSNYIKGSICYKISHDLISDVLINSIENLSSLCHTIALQLENINHDNLDDYIEELTYLYLQTSNREKIIDYLQKSIKRSTAHNDNEKSEFYIDQICEQLNDTKGEQNLLFEMIYKKAHLFYDYGRLSETIEWCERAVKIAKANNDMARISTAYSLIALALIRQKDPDNTVVNIMREAINYAESSDNEQRLAQCYNNLGLYYLKVKRDLSEAEPYFIKGLHIGEKYDELIGILVNIGNLSEVAFMRKDFNKAIDYNKKTFIYVQKTGIKAYYQLNFLYQALYYQYAKDYNTALEYINRQIPIAEEIGNFGSLLLGYARKSEIYFIQGDFAEAHKVINEADKHRPFTDDMEAIFHYELMKSKTLYALGNHDEGVYRLRKMLQEHTKGENYVTGSFYLWTMTESEEDRLIAEKAYREILQVSCHFEFQERYAIVQSGIIPDIYQKTESEVEEDEDISLNDDSLSPEFEQWFEKLKTEESSINRELNKVLNSTVNRFLLRKFNKLNGQFRKYQKSNYEKENLAETLKENLYISELLSTIADLNRELSLEKILAKILDAAIYFLQAERGAILLKQNDNTFKTTLARDSSHNSIEPITIPKAVMTKVLESQNALFIPDLIEENPFVMSQSIADLKLRSIMCAPLSTDKHLFDQVDEIGFIYIDSTDSTDSAKFSHKGLHLLELLVSQASVALKNASLTERLNRTIEEKERVEREVRDFNLQLEDKVEERTQQLEEAHRDITANAYKSGMAEVAAEVLHNVGNALTTIKTSTQVIIDTLKKSKIDKIKNANKVLKSNTELIKAIPKGEKLVDYYSLIEKMMEEENSVVTHHIERLCEKTSAIEGILSAQQHFATSTEVTTINLPTIIDETLKIQEENIIVSGLVVIKEIGNIPLVKGHHFKLHHVLNTIIKHVLDKTASLTTEKQLKITTYHQEKSVKITLWYNTLDKEINQLNELFSGTANLEDTGRNLHASANYIREMDGSLSAIEYNGGIQFIIVLGAEK